MSVFTALVGREISERRLLLVASAFLGLVPVLAPWMPGRPERLAPEDLRTMTLLILVVLFGGATLLILGATLFVRDLNEGRMSFYYSRPIPVWALWLSRLTSALFLLIASLLLLLIPTALFDFQSWVDQLSGGGPSRAWPFLGFREVFTMSAAWQTLPALPPTALRWFIALLVTLTLLTLAHAVATAVRGRSLWVVCDLAGLVMVGAIGWTAREILVREEALGALVHAEWALLPWVLGSLLVAGAVQLSRGRTDLQLGHRYLSATLWPLLIIGALAFVAYAHWVATSDIEDLETITFVRTSPDEQWLVAGGPVRHRSRARAAFLRHADSDQSWRLGSLGVSGNWLNFSGDSGTVVWVRCESFVPLACKLWLKDLRDVASPPRPIGVPGDRLVHQMVLSHDGRRIAAAESRRVVVYEVPSGNLVAAVDADNPGALAFLSSDQIQFQVPVEGGSARSARIRRFDLDSLEVADVGVLPSGHVAWYNPYHGSVLYTGPSNSGFGLFDSSTGQQLAGLEGRWRFAPKQGAFFADGRLALSFRERHGLHLLIFSPEGEEMSRIERPRVAKVVFGGELSPGQMLIALHEVPEESATAEAPRVELDVEPLRGWTTYVLDAEAAELSPLVSGVVPLTTSPVAPERRLIASRTAILQWNPESGDYRTLIEPSRGLKAQLRERDLNQGNELPF